MSALLKAGVWEFKSPHYKVGKDYQYAPLTMIFDIKQEDFCQKARLVAGGHVVDSSMTNHIHQWFRQEQLGYYKQ